MTNWSLTIISDGTLRRLNVYLGGKRLNRYSRITELNLTRIHTPIFIFMFMNLTQPFLPSEFSKISQNFSENFSNLRVVPYLIFILANEKPRIWRPSVNFEIIIGGYKYSSFFFSNVCLSFFKVWWLKIRKWYRVRWLKRYSTVSIRINQSKRIVWFMIDGFNFENSGG